MVKKCVLGLAFVIGLVAIGLSAESTAPVLVDFSKGTIDSVNLRDDGKTLLVKLGPSRVKKETEELEGDPADVFVVSFGTHKVYRHWNAFSFTDSKIRTKEGLGVGSSIGDFEKFYGKGKFKESEGGEGFEFSLQDFHFFVSSDDKDYKIANSDSYAKVKGTEIWAW